MTNPMPSRRSVLTGGAALAAVGFVADPALADVSSGRLDRKYTRHGKHVRLTVLGTTDLHGHVYNWDYFKNAEFNNASARHPVSDAVGIARAATLIKAMRKERRGEPILTLDAGDTIQGTPLAYYYAKVEPITDGGIHPMARAMNLVRYDAAALGNHEFNYGIETLRTFEKQLDFPLLGANAVDWNSGRPEFTPYIIKEFHVGEGRKLKVGVLGLTNPGIAIWDRANVEGQMKFPGLVEQAKRYVPEMKAKGCDLVIVSAHSGMDTSSSYGDALPPENAASLVAEEVAHVDAILVGHAHSEIPQRFVRNKHTDHQVLLCEPYYWGMRVAVMDLVVREVYTKHGRQKWALVATGSQLLDSNTVDEDPKVAAAVQAQHDTVVGYVNSVVGQCTEELPAGRAPVEDVPIIDFINYVQAGAVKAGLSGADADLPVLSIAAPFSRTAVFPKGDVTVRDVAGLYVFDNTLLGVKVSGKDIREYLEYSAQYFKQVSGTGPFAMDEVTNAVTATAPNGTPDYNYDCIASGDKAKPLTYDIDIAQPVGSRIKNLAYGGAPVTDDMQFAMAVNNYRESGGGGFPHMSTATGAAPVIYNRQEEIRQLLIDWVIANKVIDPTLFASVDWKLVSDGKPITVLEG